MLANSKGSQNSEICWAELEIQLLEAVHELQ